MAKVFFTDMRCPVGTSLLEKMDRLLVEAGMGQIDFEKKFAAIKMHFGEPGNLSFLRPNFAKVVADRIKTLGGVPFLTDCSTLYTGRRKNALEHIDSAMENGFSPLSTGCQILIGDGLKGTDDVEVPIEGGIFCKTARIGRAVMDADIFISLSHFKGHEGTGFGGALKNIGMGCGSQTGKMQMHMDGKPKVVEDKCVGCQICSGYCAQDAISYTQSGKASINEETCVGCGRCLGVCNFGAIKNFQDGDNHSLNCKIAEFTKAVVDGRPTFHISVVNQVSPNCDCHFENDAAVVPDIGIFASFDPVALDVACADAVNAAPVIETSMLGDNGSAHHDHFTDLHPDTDWHGQIDHAVKIGLGEKEYELVTL